MRQNCQPDADDKGGVFFLLSRFPAIYYSERSRKHVIRSTRLVAAAPMRDGRRSHRSAWRAAPSSPNKPGPARAKIMYT
jgi:hypothetical protein